MFRSILLLVAFLLFAAPALAAGAADATDRQSLAEYGNARYDAYLGEWFDALVLLDAQQARPHGPGRPASEALVVRPGQAAGELELSYRMQQRAGRAMQAVIEGSDQSFVRNEAVFRLALMYFQKDLPEEASRTLERIRGSVPDAIRSDLDSLRANVAMAMGRDADAVAILKDLQAVAELDGFGSYNLGIALLRAGKEQDGRELLDHTGRIESEDRAVLAIRDKANLVLGELLLSERQFTAAKEVLDRVRLNGPFSNRALLSSGWADASRERFEQALVPWSLLAEREVTDPAVQEAMLAVPYAYGRLGVFSTAALKYEAALKAFGGEIARLDASVAGIRQGAFLTSLARAELNQDADWDVNLRELAEMPETACLLDLMASNDFQEALKNYLDLEQLRKNLDTWSGDLAAFEDIIRLRWLHYDRLMPAIDREYNRLGSEMRLRSERRDRIARQLDAMVAEPRPELLITAEERSLDEQVARLEKLIPPRREQAAGRLYVRIKRLRAALIWNIYGEYDKRFARTRERLRELDRELDALNRQFQGVARTRQTAIGSYQGYTDLMRRLKLRIAADQEKVQALTARQAQVLESMAVNELTRLRERLEEFQVKARYAVADSYDRAGKAQLRKRY